MLYIVLLLLSFAGTSQSLPSGCINQDGVIFCYGNCHNNPDGSVTCENVEPPSDPTPNPDNPLER